MVNEERPNQFIGQMLGDSQSKEYPMPNLPAQCFQVMRDAGLPLT
jgi:hypothetical protein